MTADAEHCRSRDPLLEHLCVRSPDLRSGHEAELIAQPATHLVEHSQGSGLLARPRERDHVARDRALVERLSLGQLLKEPERPVMPANLRGYLGIVDDRAIPEPGQ